ncbi:hypothetical protein BZG23_08555 [Salinivibrio sp. ML290]|nr:hypothetical protein BZG23_08555 [Salinivibrio sp. ML290]
MRTQNAPVNASVNAPVNNIDAVDIQGLKTPEAIIALLAADNTLTRPQLAERIGQRHSHHWSHLGQVIASAKAKD